MLFPGAASILLLFALNNNSPSGRPKTQQTKYNELLTWLDTSTTKPKVSIELSQIQGGYGAILNTDVVEDELIFCVPRTLCITLDDAILDKDCGKTFLDLMGKAGPGGNTVVMAGYIAKEYLLMQERANNAKELQEKGVDIDLSGRYDPYLSILPWERGMNGQEHVLFWEDAKVDKFLKNTMCYDETVALRAEVNLAIKVLDGIIGPSIRKARGETKFGWLAWEKLTASGPPSEFVEGLPEAVKGAFVSLLTRSFQDSSEDCLDPTADTNDTGTSDEDKDETDDDDDDDDDAEKLVPLLDMLQHSISPNVKHAMRLSDGMVEVRARTDLKAGTELLNQYRSEEEEGTMPKHRFFSRFGFVPGIRMEELPDLMEDKTSFFYPQRAEV